MARVYCIFNKVTTEERISPFSAIRGLTSERRISRKDEQQASYRDAVCLLVFFRVAHVPYSNKSVSLAEYTVCMYTTQRAQCTQTALSPDLTAQEPCDGPEADTPHPTHQGQAGCCPWALRAAAGGRSCSHRLWWHAPGSLCATLLPDSMLVSALLSWDWVWSK